jgi:hypothetical protein
MSEPTSSTGREFESATAQPDQQEDRHERPLVAVAWMVGFSALFLAGCIDTQMSFGAGFAVAAVAAMVTVIACVMLKTK